jgi:Holliday junction resolvase RusA-like endonuclease
MSTTGTPPAGASPTVVTPRRWSFSLPILPPGVNHQYRLTEDRGGKVLTKEAKELRSHFTAKARSVGFVPDLRAQYGVRVTFTMPGWSQDIDGPVKALLDSIFLPDTGGKTAWDHRIVELQVTKNVEPKMHQTDVTIYEVCPPDGRRRK